MQQSMDSSHHLNKKYLKIQNRFHRYLFNFIGSISIIQYPNSSWFAYTQTGKEFSTELVQLSPLSFVLSEVLCPLLVHQLLDSTRAPGRGYVHAKTISEIMPTRQNIRGLRALQNYVVHKCE